MRVLVTGGAGFIGSRVVERLLGRRDEVIVLDVARASEPGARYVHASVLDEQSMRWHIRDVDAVVHLAGFVREGVRKQPYDGSSLQLQGTLNVLEACRRNGVPHVAYASSFYVYDGIPEDQSVDESSQLDILGMELFGANKLAGEMLCRQFSEAHDLECSIFRIGAAYGPGGSSAVGDFIDTGLSGETIEVWGAGKRRNQYTYVGDIADGIVAGLGRAGETYNLISPEASSTGDLGRLLSEEFGFEVTFDETRPEGPSFPYMSSQKAIDDLGWSPIALREGVHRTVEEAVAELRASSG